MCNSECKKALVSREGDILKVNIDAPPVEGKANYRLLEILSDYFHVPLGRVRLISGYTSRNKVIEINAQ